MLAKLNKMQISLNLFKYFEITNMSMVGVQNFIGVQSKFIGKKKFFGKTQMAYDVLILDENLREMKDQKMGSFSL